MGVPEVWASGQGGLLDVITRPAFAHNNTVYFCFSEREDGGGHTAVASATLNSGNAPRLEDLSIIFRQEGPAVLGQSLRLPHRAGADGNLFVTLGEHFTYRDEAQNLRNHLGKIIRIAPDGSVPQDNPFAGRDERKPEIWSYGHRNAQGARVQSGERRSLGNRAWPARRRRGQHHRQGQELRLAGDRLWHRLQRRQIHESTAKPGMEQPIKYWVPSIAPSGMAFYTGELFPKWNGSLFTGALAGQMLVRLSLDGDSVTGEERLLQDLNERIRDVRQGPDGALWLLTDNAAGRILRVSPAK